MISLFLFKPRKEKETNKYKDFFKSTKFTKLFKFHKIKKLNTQNKNYIDFLMKGKYFTFYHFL